MISKSMGHKDLNTTAIANNENHGAENVIARISDEQFKAGPVIPQALSRDQFILIIPDLVNIEKIKMDCAIQNLDYKKALLFIHLVCEKTAYIKSYKPFKWTENEKAVKEETLVTKRSVELPSQTLKHYFSNDAFKYYKILYDLGILFRAPFEKGKSFAYGLKVGYYTSRFKLVLLEDYAIMNKFRRNAKALEKATKSKIPKTETTVNLDIYDLEQHFCELFDKTRFSVDFHAAEDALFSKYNSEPFFPLINYTKREYNEVFKSFSAYHAGIRDLVNVLNGKYFFSRHIKFSRSGTPKTQGRFYTSLSQMNKIVRGMLYYDGQKVVQMDVKNCTPYLLSNYLPTLFTLDQETLLRLSNNAGFIFRYFKYNWTETRLHISPDIVKIWLKKKLKPKSSSLGCTVSSKDFKKYGFVYQVIDFKQSIDTTTVKVANLPSSLPYGGQQIYQVSSNNSTILSSLRELEKPNNPLDSIVDSEMDVNLSEKETKSTMDKGLNVSPGKNNLGAGCNYDCTHNLNLMFCSQSGRGNGQKYHDYDYNLSVISKKSVRLSKRIDQS